MIRAVIFDQDGILFDTERVYHEAFVKAGEEYGLADARLDVDNCTGRSYEDIRIYCTDKYGPDFPYDDFMGRRLVHYREIVDREGLILKPGVREILKFLKDSGIPASVCTSTGPDLTLRQLEESGLAPFFSDVVYGDMVRNGKPAPDIYLLACRRLSVDPSDAVGVEDSFNGVRAVHAAGMRAVMVPDLLIPDDEMRRLAYRIDKDLNQTLHWLQNEISI